MNFASCTIWVLVSQYLILVSSAAECCAVSSVQEDESETKEHVQTCFKIRDTKKILWMYLNMSIINGTAQPLLVDCKQFNTLIFHTYIMIISDDLCFIYI